MEKGKTRAELRRLLKKDRERRAAKRLKDKDDTDVRMKRSWFDRMKRGGFDRG